MRKLKARIIDIDGTLADIGSIVHLIKKVEGRKNKDFAEFHKHSEHVPVNQEVIDYILETVELGMVPVVLTSRREMWYGETKRFLDRAMPEGIDWHGPFMRPDDDFSKDYELKRKMLSYLNRHYDIRGAIDDNPNVIAMFQELGIPVVVAPGHREWKEAEVVS